MNNNRTKHAFVTAGAAFGLCVLAMLAGGLTWFTGAAGWLIFFSLALAVVVGVLALEYLTKIDKIEWKAEQASVYERMEDAIKCVAAEERSHETTKRNLTDVRQQLNKERAATQHAQTEFNNMSDRASQRAAQVKDLQSQLDELMGLNMKEATRHAETLQNLHDKVQADNDTWRKQVSAMRESAYKLAVHIEGSANGLPEEWEAWGDELAQSLRELAQVENVIDDSQLTIPVELVSVEEYLTPAQELDKAQVIAFQHVAMPPAQVQPSPMHELNRLIDEVKEGQAIRRVRLDDIIKAIESGYELSQEFEAANLRGPAYVTDELIRNERAIVESWQRATMRAYIEQARANGCPAYYPDPVSELDDARLAVEYDCQQHAMGDK